MGQCWEPEPGRRSTFESLVKSIEQIVMRARSDSLSAATTFYVNIAVIARNRWQQMSSLSPWSETNEEAGSEAEASVSPV